MSGTTPFGRSLSQLQSGGFYSGGRLFPGMNFCWNNLPGYHKPAPAPQAPATSLATAQGVQQAAKEAVASDFEAPRTLQKSASTSVLALLGRISALQDVPQRQEKVAQAHIPVVNTAVAVVEKAAQDTQLSGRAVPRGLPSETRAGTRAPSPSLGAETAGSALLGARSRAALEKVAAGPLLPMKPGTLPTQNRPSPALPGPKFMDTPHNYTSDPMRSGAPHPQPVSRMEILNPKGLAGPIPASQSHGFLSAR
jgi:hypothetical protein